MSREAGFSKLIRPALYILDLLIIILLAFFLLTDDVINITIFSFFWFIMSVSFSFYEIYRFTKITKVVGLLIKQISFFILGILSLLYVKNIDIPLKTILNFFSFLLIVLFFWRLLLFFLFRKYRLITGGNFRRVVIIGSNKSTKMLQEFFDNKLEYGYKFMGFFTDIEDADKQGTIEQSFSFIQKNHIDEIYCSLKELPNKVVDDFIDFCDLKLVTLKFIPDSRGLFTKNIRVDYYEITPVLSLRVIPLDDPINYWIKRVFDIGFSLIIICFILSWLIPLLGLIIVIESRGPVFFRQNRPGIKEEGFECYKFRSMTLNSRTEDSATKNDSRITKVGRFIRRTSIDELPQFFNVLFGHMSVVGPRPHLWRQNEIYGDKIPKYMVRHFVKPGVTGLAQTKGYRGEILTREDILNRTKYDVFYIENWSLLLDINIIVNTVINVFKGEDKAY